jgi:hypothetical protein
MDYRKYKEQIMDFSNISKKLDQLNNKDTNMKPFQHKPGSGSLFQNQYKNKDTHPDYTGKILVSRDYKAGDEIKLAAWKRESTKGTFLSLGENTYEPQVIENPISRGDHE